ncbi:MAG: hypothetical protein A3B25_02135 [Candidatus Ryanbacteria bacterium RIFCSPLOWO2_01_FULL_48_26]|uniref:Glycosyltransferase 2-like domain-containing protein n=1 Tax=Candidatus Ryanbacteria bacterium RIFCSPLOWO2_01_FULL_48_26 TaxID=1802126 RepID=A0A1G2GT53_9BACT|nr:MAG: hypothetical protein A3B25_02135 [Candidatus Ryanbacteria bacterium RIFCSPLOWO2_01_FULL_48_26]
MQNKKLVSIIIPAYNAEKYIKESVESALGQTYPLVEVIVIDDGSTDGTKAILDPYIRGGKIRYFRQDNRGLAASRNAGIRGSSGEFIAFLDADDLFLPAKIESQVHALETNSAYGVCYSDILHFTDPPAGGGTRQFYHHRYRYPSGDLFEDLLHRQFINPLTVLVRKNVLDRFGVFDENLLRSEDWDLWLRWARAGVRFFYLDKALAHYRVRTIGNLSSMKSEPLMKEKNLELFERVGSMLSTIEKKQYKFDAIMHRLRFKRVAAYLMIGDARAGYQKAQGFWWRWAIRVLPGSAWKALLGFIRTLKHRILLKKL